LRSLCTSSRTCSRASRKNCSTSDRCAIISCATHTESLEAQFVTNVHVAFVTHLLIYLRYNKLRNTYRSTNTPQVSAQLAAAKEPAPTSLQHTATNTLQHTATHCSTLQHTATHCNTLIIYMNRGGGQGEGVDRGEPFDFRMLTLLEFDKFAQPCVFDVWQNILTSQLYSHVIYYIQQRAEILRISEILKMPTSSTVI